MVDKRIKCRLYDSRVASLHGVKPCQLSELLYVIRVTFHQLGNEQRVIIRDVLPCVIESSCDVSHPFLLTDFVQEHHVAEFIERHLIVAEDVEKHVALASKHTIPHPVVHLPMRAQFPLESQRIVIRVDILEFINTHNEFLSLFLCYLLRQVENLVKGILLILEVNAKR